MNAFTKLLAAATFAIAAIGFATPGQAGLFSVFQPKSKVVATVSLSQQKMFLEVTDRRGNSEVHVWDVSTGKAGFETPKGTWRPKWLSKDHKSSQYNDAPMPYSVFFVGGYAVHGTDAVAKLGQPASHGCIRLTTENAATFYALVDSYGKFNTRIVITD